MTLPITLFLVTVGLFALFWGVSLVAQGYLYQQPAAHLPARAAGAALLVALFLTLWVWVDRRNPGKYDTFFQFAGESAQPFTEFEAVRWHATPVGKGFKTDAQGKPVETTTLFKQAPGGKTAAFVAEKTGEPFKLNDHATLTAGLLVKAGEGGEPVRFNAEMKGDERTGNVTYTGDRKRFVEEDGGRYIWADQLGVMYVPNTGVVVIALLLNFLLFVVWFVAFWPVLQFTWGHALGLAAVCGLVTMLVVMPLLFRPNRAPPEPAVALSSIFHAPRTGPVGG